MCIRDSNNIRANGTVALTFSPDLFAGRHVLVVEAGHDEMITFFNISGAMVYVDANGNSTGYEDVHTKIAMCRKHYEACGLGAGYVDQFVR